MVSDGEIYAKAAELLGEGGHCKGNLKTQEGRMCALGALRDAEQLLTGNKWGTGYHRLGTEAAAKLIRRGQLDFNPDDRIANPYSLAPVAYWNDLPETTGEEVIMLFKECAHEGE